MNHILRIRRYDQGFTQGDRIKLKSTQNVQFLPLFGENLFEKAQHTKVCEHFSNRFSPNRGKKWTFTRLMRLPWGFTLLELLIGMLVSNLLIAGFAMVYLSVKNNNNWQQALAEVVDTGRFAVNILNQRLRVAGFQTCDQPTNHAVDLVNAIHGYSSQTIPDWLQGQVVAGTDAVVINSCVNDESLSQNTVWTTMAYYIGDTGRKNSVGGSVLALYQKPLNGQRKELAAGVANLKFAYGVVLQDPNNIGAYQSANSVSDWRQVRSIAIQLLVNSIEPAVKQPMTYSFNHQFITPTDLLWHQPLTTYIALREWYAAPNTA